MTTSRQRVIKTLNHEAVDRAPRDVWLQPGLDKLRGDELAEMFYRYPADIERADFRYPRGARSQGKPSEAGEYTDAWGCVWRVTEPGLEGELQGAPLPHASDIPHYKIPWELLDGPRLDRVNQACAASNRFVLARSETRPFDRLQALRGRTAALNDLTHNSRALRTLLEEIHGFCCKDLQLWADTDVDGVVLQDNWGLPQLLRTGPQLFRSHFKALYREYCNILHAKDKFAFFYCEGPPGDLFRELASTGIDALSCPLSAADVTALASEFRGRITLWGGLDPQQFLPGVKSDAVRTSVRRLREAFDYGNGGLIAYCPWMLKTPFANVAGMFDAWLQPISMRRQRQAAEG